MTKSYELIVSGKGVRDMPEMGIFEAANEDEAWEVVKSYCDIEGDPEWLYDNYSVIEVPE